MGRKGLSWVVVLSVVLICGVGTATSTAGIRSDALVLVNSASSSYYVDFQHYIQPYLDNFGIPYTVIDIHTAALTSAVRDYAVIIVGHRQLDPAGTYLDASEQGYISSAVNDGTGLVSFDNDLSIGGVPRYQFVQDIFGFGYGGTTSGSGVAFPSGSSHYITERHQPGETISTKAMSLAGITLPGDVTAVATTGAQPFLAVTTFGSGRAVQWGSYNWMSKAVKGPLFGLDDLVWRSIVWAARKPFVMRGLPPFVTMRVDDESGGFAWIHIANEFGIKPWAGIFVSNISDTEAADLSGLVNSGNATTAIHSFTDGDWFYWDSDTQLVANFAYGTQWHTNHNIPISKFVVPHNYQFSTNAFHGLKDWGIGLVGTVIDPGEDTSAPWIMNGPYRLYETGSCMASLPLYYADFMDIPGHPEFNGQFFNCITEIRDDAGYEWNLIFDDVAGSIGRGTRQTKRALDSMALATLFTHSVSGDWDANSPANWRLILQGITDDLSSYNPIYVTMDHACQYIRATRTSHVTSAIYEPTSRQVTAHLEGVTDLNTAFYVFMDGEAYVMVDVPVFNGSINVVYDTSTTNPAPMISTLSPNSATAGGAAFTLTVSGTNFVSGSVVRWSGSDRPTTYVSATQLTASISVANIATAGTVQVTVFNPTPGGGVSNAVTFSIIPGLSSLSLNPSTVVGGNNSTGTVTLNGTAVQDTVVSLLSSKSSVATVPANVTVLSGNTSATFTVTTYPVFSSTAVVISASYGGVTKSKTLTVKPPSLYSLSLSPSTVVGGKTSSGTVTLNGTAPGDTVVSLSSSNTSVATVPANVTVLSGNTKATFTVTTNLVSSSTAVTISAFYSGVTRSKTLTVKPPSLYSLSLSPSTVVGGNNSTGTVALNGTAPGDTVVSLSSSNTSVATVPANVTVLRGNTTATFTVTTKKVTSLRSPTISALYAGVTKTAKLTVTP